jgi:hypothetical protein
MLDSAENNTVHQDCRYRKLAVRATSLTVIFRYSSFEAKIQPPVC